MYVPLIPSVIHMYFWIAGIYFLTNSDVETLSKLHGIVLILLLLDAFYHLFGIVNGTISYRLKRLKDNWFLRIVRIILIGIILFIYFNKDIQLPRIEILVWLSLADWILYRVIQILNIIKCYRLSKSGDESIGKRTTIDENGVRKHY